VSSQAYTLEVGAGSDVYPMVVHMGEGYDWDAADSVAALDAGSQPPESPNLEAFHLDPEVDFTDVVSQGYVYASGLLVSDALRRLLDAHAVQAFVGFPAGVVSGDVRRDYWWLHFVDDSERRIDYRRSRFRVSGGSAHDDPRLPIGSSEELAEAARRLSSRLGAAIVAERLVFLPGTRPLDLFCVALTPRRLFVSELLAAELMASGMTGFQLRAAETHVVWPGADEP
jgi:hypothetical protein